MATISIQNKTFHLPEKGSPCELWRSYFEKLKKELGHKNARMIWLITWNENGSASCTTYPAFNRWLKRNDIDVAGHAGKAIADISQIGSNVLGLSKNLTKMLSIGIPVTLGGILLTLIVLLLNTAKKKDLSDVAMLLPQGRALGAAKLLQK